MAESSGRKFGGAWERIIQTRARSNGLLILKNDLSAKFIGGGGVRVVKSDLDFRVFTRQGKAAYFDAKTFSNPYFDFSDLKEHQVQRSLLYLDWNISSGFLCWFRPTDRVAFFKGSLIAQQGPGTRFQPKDGLDIGNIQNFDLRAIMEL